MILVFDHTPKKGRCKTSQPKKTTDLFIMIIWISTILFSLDGYTLLFPMLGQNLHDFTPFSPDVGGTRAIPIPIMMDASLLPFVIKKW